MPQHTNAVLVLIASPGDTAAERAVVSEQLNDWNISRGRREGVALLPWRFERHAVPTLGGHAQAIINAQAVDRADAVVAFFDSRLGTATNVDVSGTAEEINRAADAGKPVHVYFSEEELPRDVEVEQLQALRDFKEGLESRGLLGTYSDPSDLAGQVVRALEHDIDENSWGEPLAPAQSRAGTELRWQHIYEREQQGTDNRGKIKYRTTSNELRVTNNGAVAAEGLQFTVTGAGDDAEDSFHLEGPDGPVDLPAHSEMAWTMIATGWGGPTYVKIEATWTEAGIEKQQSWTVVLKS